MIGRGNVYIWLCMMREYKNHKNIIVVFHISVAVPYRL